MINHVRTLLLNRPASYFDGVSNAQYIPGDFQPVGLPVHLRTLRDIIVPQGLDKFGENYIADTIMRVLHAPDILPYVTKLDSRYTYLNSPELLARSVEAPLEQTRFQSATCDITPHYKLTGGGYPQDIGTSGVHSWTLVPTDLHRVQVTHNRGKEEILVVTNGTRQTTPISLIPGYLQVYFTAPTTKLTGWFKYTCSTSLAVPYNLGTIQAEIEKYMARPGNMQQIFTGVDLYANELVELQDAWKYSLEVNIRVAAVILGLIYQLEGLRLNRG